LGSCDFGQLCLGYISKFVKIEKYIILKTVVCGWETLYGAFSLLLFYLRHYEKLFTLRHPKRTCQLTSAFTSCVSDQVVDGPLHYAPEAMTLFDYRTDHLSFDKAVACCNIPSLGANVKQQGSRIYRYRIYIMETHVYIYNVYLMISNGYLMDIWQISMDNNGSPARNGRSGPRKSPPSCTSCLWVLPLP
jgi:hypothetical protein